MVLIFKLSVEFFDANRPPFDLDPLKLETNWMTLRNSVEKDSLSFGNIRSHPLSWFIFAQTRADSP